MNIVESYLEELNNSQKNIQYVYRYVDNKNRGIMSDDYFHNDKFHNAFKKVDWLPAPKKKGYPKDIRFYFTEKGNKKFMRTGYNEFKKLIPSIKVIKKILSEKHKIIFQDIYQVAIKE